jgi:pre-mRNA cleavage complex 2 protein Pcf11
MLRFSLQYERTRPCLWWTETARLVHLVYMTDTDGRWSQSAPPEKLPKLYLIDSISKNIGAPYTTHLLPPIMPRLYARTYRDVDGVTKSKMEEMVGLWRTSAPDGGDLYGSNVREAVERDIFGSAGYQRVAPPSREKVLATMRAALEYHHRESVARPWDNAAQQNLAVLMQLNEMLNTRQLPPMELQQIMDKLQAMAPKPSQPPISQPTPPSFNPANPVAPPTPNLPPFPPNLPRQGGLTPVIPAVPTPPQSVSTPVPPPAVSAPNPSSLTNASVPSLSAPGLPENFADLLRNLNSSGALSQPRTPEIPPAVLPTRSRLQDYEDMILSLDVQLGALDVNRCVCALESYTDTETDTSQHGFDPTRSSAGTMSAVFYAFPRGRRQAQGSHGLALPSKQAGAPVWSRRPPALAPPRRGEWESLNSSLDYM